MAQYMYTLLTLAVSCSVRREISPCSCAVHPVSRMIVLTCDGVDSFNRVFDAVQNRFNPEVKIQLQVNRSQLEDMETKAFSDMNLRLKNLKLNNDNLKTLPESSFRNLTNLEFLSLSYNHLEEVPRHIFPHMPNLGTLDLGAQYIRRIGADDFRRLPRIEHLMLFSNELSEIAAGSLPTTLRTLHLSHNNLTTLNGTLRHMQELKLAFLNDNKLHSLDGELPPFSGKLFSILAHNNELTHLPPDLKTLANLAYLYVRENRLSALDGVLRHSRHLEIFEANTNRIERLLADDFADCEKLEMLDVGSNRIRSVNGSLLALKQLRTANLTNNLLTEFSLNEIRGLRRLRVLDLSRNQIERLSGKTNIVEPDLFVIELRLQHNRLMSLDGALMGMDRLVQLDLSHNLLGVIAPDDLIGLEELDVLDISYNALQTLEETSKSVLPKLTKLNASNNNLTKLDRDFNGLPALCFVDLSNNRIASISPNLVNNTRCISHSVVTKMDILLQDNPVLCRHDLDQLMQVLNAQEARLKGLAHCLVSHEQLAIVVPPPADGTTGDIPVDPLAASGAPLPNIVQSLLQQLPVAPTAIIQKTPSIVQIILPEDALKVDRTAEPAPPTTTTEQPFVETTVVSVTPPPSPIIVTTMLSNFIPTAVPPLLVDTHNSIHREQHSEAALAAAAAAVAVDAVDAASAAVADTETPPPPTPTTTLSNAIQQQLDDESPAEVIGADDDAPLPVDHGAADTGSEQQQQPSNAVAQSDAPLIEVIAVPAALHATEDLASEPTAEVAAAEHGEQEAIEVEKVEEVVEEETPPQPPPQPEAEELNGGADLVHMIDAATQT